MLDDELAAMQAAIFDRFGSSSHWVGSVHVSVDGGATWEGLVEVFDLFGHPTATRCYGWSQPGDAGSRRVVLILREGAVKSPEHAVLAFLGDAR